MDEDRDGERAQAGDGPPPWESVDRGDQTRSAVAPGEHDPWAPAGQSRAPGGSEASPYGTTLPTYAAPAGRGRARAFVGIAVGAVLALAASAFAVTSFGDDGPSSPEAAVEELFAAVEARDVLGVLDTLAPAEREVYQPFVEDVVGELQRLRVLSDDLDLGDVDGFELDVEGLELSSEGLGEGVSVVRVTGGSITSTVTPEEVPLGSFVRDLMDDPDSGVDLEPLTATEDLVDEEPVEIVVLDDGGWHVSLHYSIAEAARKEAGAPLPVFGGGIQPDGADTPEAAVEELVRAGIDLDVRRVIALLPPGEMSALHDYAPLFLDDVDRAVEELRTEGDLAISLDELELTSEVDGDLARVSVVGFAASGRVDGEPFAAAWDGECFSGTFAGEPEEVCVGDAELSGGGFADELAEAGMGLVAVERDGEWYVTPTRTLFEYGLTVLRALDPEDLEDPEAFFSERFGFSPFLGPGGTDETWSGSDAGSEVDPGAPDGGTDPYVECSTVYEDLPIDATDEQYAEADAAFDECVERLTGIDPSPPPEALEECAPVYDELAPDATADEIAAADQAHTDCIDSVFGGA